MLSRSKFLLMNVIFISAAMMIPFLLRFWPEKALAIPTPNITNITEKPETKPVSKINTPIKQSTFNKNPKKSNNKEAIKRAQHFDPRRSVEFTEDKEMPENDLKAQNGPTPEPLIPANFDLDIEGVNNLEISPGVFVLHNYSATRSSRKFEFKNYSIEIVTFDSGFMKEHFVWLPPFKWVLPKGLTKKQIDLFWKQPENHWHFDDSNMWHTGVVWEITNGEMSHCNEDTCRNHNYTHHLNFCDWPKPVSNPQFKGNLFAFGGHLIEIFQHFFDNGVPHMAFASIATGLDPTNVTVSTAACNGITQQVVQRLGFKIKQSCASKSHVVSATNLIVIPSMRVLHPAYYDWYRMRMNFPHPEQTDILIIPRGGGAGGGNARIIYNVRDIREPLAKIHGSDHVKIHSGGGGLDDLIRTFTKAKAIVGPHGGAFYNQFFANEGTDIIEMIPQLSSGKYPKQNHWDRLIPFAHLSMYSNTLLLRENFWRYITMDVDINFNIDVNNFMEWSKQVPSLK